LTFGGGWRQWRHGFEGVMTQTTAFDFSLLARNGVALQTFAAGDKIFVTDDEAAAMFVVRSGKINIMASGVVLESIGPGGLFGEMALIDGAPRSATAVAAEDSEVAPVDRSAFLFMVRQSPDFALEVMSVLAARIRRMNEGL
jgi:CRP/FNR family cyclic AMP-dependent transcriptional regulator